MVDWNRVSEATSTTNKPTPGWLFKEICQDADSFPDDVPELAEFLMRCVVCDNRTVSMKGGLCIRHLADEVPAFRKFMQRCPEALAALGKAAEPPQLAQAQSIERPEVKVAREVASRALQACLSRGDPKKEAHKAALKSKCEGFGNYAPPPEDSEPKGVVDQVGSFIGDALADTVDDFREKGAVGAVKDGAMDAADLIMDGVGAAWRMLAGRKAAEAVAARQSAAAADTRICRPRASPVALPPQAGGYGQAGQTGGNAPEGALGSRPVGAKFAFHVPELQQQQQIQQQQLLQQQQSQMQQAQAAASSAQPAQPAPAAVIAEPEDLLSFGQNAAPADTPALL